MQNHNKLQIAKIQVRNRTVLTLTCIPHFQNILIYDDQNFRFGKKGKTFNRI